MLDVVCLRFFCAIIFANEVACQVHAALEQVSGTVAELELVSKLRSYHSAYGAKEYGKEPIMNQLDERLKELNISLNQLALANGSGIWCFCICTSETQLQQLYGHYTSGTMKSIFETVFTLLLDRTITIRDLTWKLEDYEACQKRINELSTAG